MKKSTLILFILSCLFFIYLIAADLRLKKAYDRIDKTDPFWNYTKLARGLFHHLKISGGNITRMAFNPGPHGSVGVLNEFEDRLKEQVKTKIYNDTLFLSLDPRKEPPNVRDWMRGHVLMTISCPFLYSVNAANTNIDLYKMNQKSININLSGKSKMEMESFNPDFDSVTIHQSDSTQLIFEMEEDIKSSGVMHIRSLYADIRNQSLLDIGHFQIGALQQYVGDTAAILLSGFSLRKLK